MTSTHLSAYGVLALVVLLAILGAVLVGVKLRAASRRGCGVKIYDFGADLTLPSRLHSRSYQIALYLTMKSMPAEADGASNVSARAATR